MGTVIKDKAQEHYQAQDGARGEELGPVSPAPFPQHRPPTVLHNTNSTFFFFSFPTDPERKLTETSEQTEASIKVYKELRHFWEVLFGISAALGGRSGDSPTTGIASSRRGETLQK